MSYFYTRLAGYYRGVAAALQGSAKAASGFANSTDIGQSREKVFRDFLKHHCPLNCDVALGGFLFHFDGRESHQIDVIVATTTSPRYAFHNPTGEGKTFTPVEGTVAVASVKSSLSKPELNDALSNIASIPETMDLAGRQILGVSIRNYDHWPYKIIVSFDGPRPMTLFENLRAFYGEHPTIPLNRWPDIIYVVGKYFIIKGSASLQLTGRTD